MNEIQRTLTKIEALREQQRFDLEVLGLWAHAEEFTGHTHETIRAFTFRPDFLTKEQKREMRTHPKKYTDKNWHNAIRLKDETLIPMPGIPRPAPPDTTKVEVRYVV